MSTITVHHLENSRSQRALWLLEELGVEYEVKHYKRVADHAAEEDLRKVHPLGRSPVITHGDRVVAESGAIVEYLVDHFGEGRMRPSAGSDDLERHRYYMHFAEGTLAPLALMKMISSMMRKKVPLLGRVIAGKLDARTDRVLQTSLDLMERDLEGREWFAGELSGADVMMSYPAQAAIARSNVQGGLPNLRAWLARIDARPAYQRALESGGGHTILT